MKRLLKGGRVVDPANGIDGAFDVLIDGDRIARVGRDLPVDDDVQVDRRADGVRRRARAHRHARAPARAGAGAQGDDRDRRAVGRRRRVHGRGLHAEHDAGQRQRQHHGVDAQEGRRGQPGAGLSDRRRLARHQGRAAGRHRRAARGGLRRDLRRRPARGDGAADAPRARVRVDVRHAGHRPLRGRLAQGRRRRARGLSRVDARPAGPARRRRDRHGPARRHAGRADRRAVFTSRT